MKYMSVTEIRNEFLNFFKSKEHYVVNSYPLVPINDKSLLLIGAGMAPLKNYFIGKEIPPSKRMSTCQKCIRTGDIENVGRTARHATFFEMLGNFSFGDYFKKEATAWAWEFVTEKLEIDPKYLWVTVYEEDDEALEIWRDKVGVKPERIVKLGKEDNFWEIGNGTGPCGPCSEIYIDRGEKFGCNCPDCKPGCDCDRFLEFWNLVFTQFDKDEAGNYNSLSAPNIDTGMGLERIACIMQGVDNIFDIDTMVKIRNHICNMANYDYNSDNDKDVSIRIITDHIRAISFMICDGVLPSNEGRGYILRRLLRRAARHGKMVGITSEFLFLICDTVIKEYAPSYKELLDKEGLIKKIIKIEEEKFIETLEQGMSILMDYIDEVKVRNGNKLSGEQAFKLYDTYGFPLELTLEILNENGLSVDEDSFKINMEEQRNKARKARENMNLAGWKEDELEGLDNIEPTVFEGYENYISESRVLYIKNDNGEEKLGEGESGIILLDRTPFYPEGGGQIGDIGEIKGESFLAIVRNTKKGPKGKIIHQVEIESGEVGLGDCVTGIINLSVRRKIESNHTATHIMHKVLKNVIGNHVNQAGSLVDNEKLRFDFSHFEAVKHEELLEIESKVNNIISKAYPVKYEYMTLEEAKIKGATALFDEKYGDKVRVLSIGDFSKELCGGAHVKNSSEINMFKIISESGVAAGIRRIEAITGEAVYQYILKKEELLRNISNTLKTKEDSLLSKIEGISIDNRDLKREIIELKGKLIRSTLSDISNDVTDVKGVKIYAKIYEAMSSVDLKDTIQIIRDKELADVIVISSVESEKINFVAFASEEAIKQGVHAGNIVKEIATIAGGSGGGKPNQAQAGGKDISKIKQAMDEVYSVIEKQLL
ncbi:MAG: alanine--tRNA ligase [Filifactoraceae bacterium]